MPPDVLEMATKFMRDPIRILVKNQELTLGGIKQFYIVGKEDSKVDALCDLFETLTNTQAIIFCKFHSTVDWLTFKLTVRDYTVTMESDRRAVKGFRSGSSRALIVSDNSYDMNVQQVPLVINYDEHGDLEGYIHRIGRGGLLGRKGVVINLVTDREVSKMREIEEFYKTTIEEIEMPKDIAGRLRDMQFTFSRRMLIYALQKSNPF